MRPQSCDCSLACRKGMKKCVCSATNCYAPERRWRLTFGRLLGLALLPSSYRKSKHVFRKLTKAIYGWNSYEMTAELLMIG